MKINHGAVWIVASISVAAGAAQSPSTQQIAAQLTANGLKADVSFLASDALQGRGTPSPGLDIAAEFIASQFRGIGLHPAGDDGYFQTAAFASVTPNPEGAQLTFEIGGKTIAVDKTASSVGEAAALDVKGAGAYLVTAANVASLGETPVEDVRGRVLIIAGGARTTRLQLTTLMRLQPVLVIGVVNNPVRPFGAGMPRLRDASAPVLPSVTVWDKAVSEALADAKPGSLEATVSAHIAAPKIETVKLRNVVGVLRGADAALANAHVLVTAHYDHLGVRGTGGGDHIFNGANDDASGTASVIEIARTLASSSARPKRSIVFVALFGEEAGLLGSRYYAQHPVFPLKSTVADLNLEQMGRTDDNTGPRVGILNATGFDYTNITGVLAKAGEEFGIQVLKDEESSDPFYARSDNQAFADAGVPSHTLSVGYVFPDYHQPGDEWPKLDYENMAKVDRAVALALFRIADSIEPPQWNLANPKTAPYVKAR